MKPPSTSLFAFLPALLSLSSILVSAQNTQADQNFIGSTPAQRLYIDAVQAAAVLQAATIEATRINSPSNIAVVDPSALLVAFVRMDNAFPGSIDVAQKKARTVGLFNGAYTTADLYNASQPGQSLYGVEETNGGLVVFGGGLPIFLDGHFIGAVGVSGGSTTQDTMVAMAGVAGLKGAVS